MGRAIGAFEQLILFALIELGDEGYGAAVGRAIEARTGQETSAGAVYTALDRLEGRGLVESRIGEPTSERGGRRKKFYRPTPAGITELKRSVEAIRAISDGLMPELERLARESGR